MRQFETIKGDRATVQLRHVREGHEYKFAFLRPDGTLCAEPHLIWHSEGDGSTGTGMAGQYLEQARAFAAQVHAGRTDA